MTPREEFDRALSHFESLTVRGESPSVENWSNDQCREHNAKHNEARASVLALYDAAASGTGTR